MFNSLARNINVVGILSSKYNVRDSLHFNVCGACIRMGTIKKIKLPKASETLGEGGGRAHEQGLHFPVRPCNY